MNNPTETPLSNVGQTQRDIKSYDLHRSKVGFETLISGRVYVRGGRLTSQKSGDHQNWA